MKDEDEDYSLSFHVDVTKCALKNLSVLKEKKKKVCSS